MYKNLLIATGNAGKIREMQKLLQDVPLKLHTPHDLGLRLHVDETGDTYQANAALKAVAYAKAAGMLALADDSGLEVDALGGAPGLYSARYAPQPKATDADRRAYMLENLAPHPQPWGARFRCWVALAAPDGTMNFAEGACEGQIIPEERGAGGFGYDPIFFLPELGKTMAELAMQEKNTLSHRARAVKAAIPLILTQLAS
jgi:XTP/dITP diphosphohydrolase